MIKIYSIEFIPIKSRVAVKPMTKIRYIIFRRVLLRSVDLKLLNFTKPL